MQMRNRFLDSKQALLVLFVLISAVPFGSNRPFFWALNLLFVTTLAFITVPTNVREWQVIQPRKVYFVYAIFVAYGVFQCMPLYSPASQIISSSILPASITVAVGPTIYAVARWITYGLLLVTTVFLFKKTGRSRQALQFTALGAAILAIYSLLALTQLGDPLLIFEKQSYKGVATGTFVNRNSFATFMALGLVLSFSFILCEIQSLINKMSTLSVILSSTKIWLNLSCIGALLLALTLTESRMGFFAACAGLFAIGLLLIPKISRYRLLTLIFMVFLPLVMLIGVLTNADSFLDRVFSVENDAGLRLDAYKLALKLIADRPLTGFGAGTFELVFPMVRDYSLNPAFVWDKAHSTYITLFVELGLIFGMAPIIIIALLVKNSVIHYMRSSVLSVRDLSCIGATIVVAVHSLVDFSMEIQAVAILYVFILAIAQTVRTKNVA